MWSKDRKYEQTNPLLKACSIVQSGIVNVNGFEAGIIPPYALIQN